MEGISIPVVRRRSGGAKVTTGQGHQWLVPRPAWDEERKARALDAMAGHLARHLGRYAVSRDAVLSADEVVEAVGGRQSAVREWLNSTVTPLRHPSGRRVYLWSDVLDAMRRA